MYASNSSVIGTGAHLQDVVVLEDRLEDSGNSSCVTRQQRQQVQYEHVLYAMAVTCSYLQRGTQLTA
jgi:hypothetical protein